VGNGRVICASVYSGPDVDFGNGPYLWIDNIDKADGVLGMFKPFFEDAAVKKVRLVLSSFLVPSPLLISSHLSAIGLA
jgi:hypothetical protein